MWWIALWFIVKGTTKCTESYQNLVAMVTCLYETPQTVQCHDRTRYKFWCWLSKFLTKELGLAKYFQLQMLVTSGISNQALVFVRDVKIFTSQTDILVKSTIFDNTLLKKGLVRDFLHRGSFRRTHNYSDLFRIRMIQDQDNSLRILKFTLL